MEDLAANFSFGNRNEENMFGAAMAIFSLTNKFKYMLIIYTSIAKKAMSNESNAGHIRSFMRLLKVSNQLYTLSYARLKNCRLVLCSTTETV